MGREAFENRMHGVPDEISRMLDIRSAQLLLCPPVPDPGVGVRIKYIDGQCSFTILTHIEYIRRAWMSPPILETPPTPLIWGQRGMYLHPVLRAQTEVDHEVRHLRVLSSIETLTRKFAFDRLACILHD